MLALVAAAVLGQSEVKRDAQFYESVGHPELAASYRRRNVVRWSVFAAGAVGMAGGLALASTARARAVWCDPYEEGLFDGDKCQRKMTGEWNLGLGIAALGFAAMLMPALLDPNPVGPEEAQRLADVHRHRLRFSLVASPRGGAVALGGEF
jgi:hypothetical protein